jgi:hypothetical protein
LTTESKFIVPDWRLYCTFYSNIRLSCLAGWYYDALSESTISPPVRDLEFSYRILCRSSFDTAVTIFDSLSVHLSLLLPTFFSSSLSLTFTHLFSPSFASLTSACHMKKVFSSYLPSPAHPLYLLFPSAFYSQRHILRARRSNTKENRTFFNLAD